MPWDAIAGTAHRPFLEKLWAPRSSHDDDARGTLVPHHEARPLQRRRAKPATGRVLEGRARRAGRPPDRGDARRRLPSLSPRRATESRRRRVRVVAVVRDIDSAAGLRARGLLTPPRAALASVPRRASRVPPPRARRAQAGPGGVHAREASRNDAPPETRVARRASFGRARSDARASVAAFGVVASRRRGGGGDVFETEKRSARGFAGRGEKTRGVRREKRVRC